MEASSYRSDLHKASGTEGAREVKSQEKFGRHRIGDVAKQTSLPSAPKSQAPFQIIPFHLTSPQAEKFENAIHNLKPGDDVATLRGEILAADFNGEITDAQTQLLEKGLDKKEALMEKTFAIPLHPKDQLIADVIAGADGKAKASHDAKGISSSTQAAERPTISRRQAARTGLGQQSVTPSRSVAADTPQISSTSTSTPISSQYEARVNDLRGKVDALKSTYTSQKGIELANEIDRCQSEIRASGQMKQLSGLMLELTKLDAQLSDIGVKGPPKVSSAPTSVSTSSVESAKKTTGRFYSSLFGRGKAKEAKAKGIDLSDVAEIRSMLSEKSKIPEQVHTIAQKAHSYIYEHGIARDDLGRRLLPREENGDVIPAHKLATDTENWLTKQQGITESALRGQFEKGLQTGEFKPPKPISLSSVQAASDAANLGKSFAVKDQIAFRFEVQADKLGKDLHPRAIQQVASGVGFDEVPSRTAKLEIKAGKEGCSLCRLATDTSQGGQAVVAASTAGQFRKAAIDMGKLRHALSDCGVPQKILDKCLLNGFLALEKLEYKELEVLCDCLKKNIEKLTILAEKVYSEEHGTEFFQVFNFAPDCNGMTNKRNYRSEQAMNDCVALSKEITEMLQVAQYRGTVRVGAIIGSDGGAPAEVHLTLLGGSAFGNDPEVYGKVMEAVSEEVKGKNVKVIYQFFNDKDVAKVLQHTKPEFVPPGLKEQAEAHFKKK
jgi:hypothetical protein